MCTFTTCKFRNYSINQSFVALPIPDFIVRTTYPELENMGGNSFAYTDTGRILCEIPSVVRLDLSLNMIILYECIEIH